MADLDPEDTKLITLARSARARTGATEGAAVRDDTGRTYVATTVDLPSLQLSALQGAVAAAVVTNLLEVDRAIVDDLSPGAPLLVADPKGELR